MNPFDSDWFLQIVERSGKAPDRKLVAVFDIAAQWIAAPGIRENLALAYARDGHEMRACPRLQNYLSATAASVGAKNPDILASHLLILLHGAIVEELRDPELHALPEAALAARAVIAQARPRLRRQRLALFSIGGLAAAAVAAVTGWQTLTIPRQPDVASTVAAAPGKVVLQPAGISPVDMEAVLTLHEQFTRGVCPAPQLLALPPGQMTAYMNAVNFRTPDNPIADRENLKAFMAWFRKTQSTECYFAPQNGHTTVAWTQG